MFPTGPPNQIHAQVAGANRAPLAAALVMLSAALAVGVAAWLIPASIHIVTWGSAGRVGRVALFAPMYLLRWAVGTSLLGALGLWLPGSRHATARGGRVWIASIVAPCSALWAWTVPFLPWVPDRFPLLLVLAGPLRWGIAIAVVVAMLARVFVKETSILRPQMSPAIGSP